ncbi:MAG: YggS family pyridoxal phosphate-dependent enzyme [Candidatus Norongarragalinales archaeon]
MEENSAKETLALKIARVKQRLATAAARSRHSLPKIVFVTKTVDAPTIACLAELESRVAVGETRVQDAFAKMLWLKQNCPQLASRIEWHFIGRLQRNKVAKAVAAFDCIQSIDSLELAQKASRAAQLAGKTIPLFIEVNIAGEASKGGVTPEKAVELARQVKELPNLRLEGLMTIAPFVEAEKTRPFFKKMRALANSLGLRTSMGMSNDFEVAVEEGADVVRIGRAIFG